MIYLIVAMDKNRLIGKDGHLPWHIKEDLQHFKETTIDKTILMGRRTFESFPKPLPRRKHIVISHNHNYQIPFDNVTIRTDVIEVIKEYQSRKEDLYVIGGKSIYSQAFPLVDVVILSLIKGEYTGDVYLPLFENDFVIESIKDFSEFQVITYRRPTNV